MKYTHQERRNKMKLMNLFNRKGESSETSFGSNNKSSKAFFISKEDYDEDKIHSKEFKELAVTLAKKIGIEKAAEELKVPASSIRSWQKAFDIYALAQNTTSSQSNKEPNDSTDKYEFGSLAQYDWFEEFEKNVEDGHWVFYDTSMYMPKKDNRDLDLHYNPRCNQAPIIPINATSCINMFSDCDNLTKLDLSKLNTVNIVSMKGMFRNCRKITTLDLDNLITSKVTDMSDMFIACTKLVKLNLSNFDTSNVTNMFSMFEHNLNLIALNLSSFDTSKVKWMDYMFQDCKRLKSLDLSNFDTSNLEMMEYMFSGCESLEVLDLSNFNTSKVRRSNSAFMNCKRLTVLDIRGFYTSYLVKPYRPAESERDPNALYGYFPEIYEVSVQNLFHGCNSLKLLKVNKHFQKSYKMHLSYDVQIEIV